MTRPPLDESQSEKDQITAHAAAVRIVTKLEARSSNWFPGLRADVVKCIQDEIVAALAGRQSCPCRTNSSNAPETLTSSPAVKAPSDLERDTPITIAFTYAMAGHVKECEDAIRELVAAAREKEREFWVMKFEHWVECQKDGGVAASFKAQGFTDCVAAMKQNDRWVPHAALKKGKPNG